jgi:hypothetical protein
MTIHRRRRCWSSIRSSDRIGVRGRFDGVGWCWVAELAVDLDEGDRADHCESIHGEWENPGDEF